MQGKRTVSKLYYLKLRRSGLLLLKESQAKINGNVPARYPRVACTLGHRPLLHLRAGSGIKHDVQVSVPAHAIAHRGQREIGRVRLAERLDLGRVIQEAGRAVPRAQSQGAAVRNREKDQVGQGCVVRALRQCVGRVQRLVVLGDDCERRSRLDGQADGSITVLALKLSMPLETALSTYRIPRSRKRRSWSQDQCH